MDTYTLPLAAVEAAQTRIAPYIRRTPMSPPPLPAGNLPGALEHDGLRFKFEQMQVAGSFKSRGVFNSLLLLPPDVRGVITASGGNHGLALAYAARRLSIPCTVYLPENAMPDRTTRIAAFGAQVIREGAVFDEANRAARARAEADKLAYVHPFNAPQMVEGNGSLALELLDDMPDIDAVIVAIGGGGLIGAVAGVLKQRKPSVRVFGVEPTGAPSMKASLDAGRVVELPGVRTIADTLAPRAVGDVTLALAQRYVDEIVLVSDLDMIAGMRWLWTHYNQLVEPAGAAALASVLTGKIDLTPFQHPAIIVCGGNAGAEGVFTSYEQRA